jgi:thioredoxin 1
LEISDQTFDQEVINSATPVLIDFWAPWCGPCKAIAPVVEEVAGTYAGRLKVVKMNVDDNPLTPSRFGVRSIPNLLLFKNGQVKDQIIGAVSFVPARRGFDLELRPSRAIGWSEQTYPFPVDTTTAGGLEPLLLPWSGGVRKYHYDGKSFAGP